MLSNNEPLSNPLIDHTISAIDQQFRLNFQDLIKESKLNAHKCQYICYQNNKSLLNAENCARNCYKPILYTKKNISNLIENTKENFEKCRFTAQSGNKDQNLVSFCSNPKIQEQILYLRFLLKVWLFNLTLRLHLKDE